jgi:flagellar assembly protein FliH
MSSTSSRILRPEESTSPTRVWWQEATVAEHPQGSPVRPEPKSPAMAADRNPDQLEKEAYQRGFTDGKGIGRELAATELQPVLDRLTKSMAEVSSLRGRIRKDAEADLVKLSIAIARRVLHRELTIDPDSIAGIIRVALEKLDSHELSQVRVHPDQEPGVRAALQRLNDGRNIELKSDPSLQCGDVLFETAQGTMDASIEMQLREIERGFADRLKR